MSTARDGALAGGAAEVCRALSELCSLDTKGTLGPAFQKFTTVLLTFVHQCEKQKSTLNHDVQRKGLSANLRSLKKLIPVLESVTQNRVRYPRNDHAKASCELVASHIRHAIESILRSAGVGESLPRQEPSEVICGDTEVYFAADVSKLVHLLSPKHRRSLQPDLKTLVSRVVNHAMMVAVTAKEDLKEEISRTTKEVLSLQDEITDRSKALESRLDFSQLASDFDQSCESLARKVLFLEGFIRDTVIHLVVDVLVQTTEPMCRIVKAATVPLKGGRILEDKDCLSVLQPLDGTLHDHMDQLCQVGSLVASSCSDSDKVDKVNEAIAAIERLDPEVLPACLAVRRDGRNKAAVAHLKLFYQDWCHEVQALVDGMLEILDLERFLEVSEIALERDLEDCRHAARIPDADFLAESVNRILGRAKQVLRVGGDIQGRNEDAIYRNGIQVFLDQITNAIALVKNLGSHAAKNIRDPLVQGQLKERCHHLIEAVRFLREGVNPENQPDLMNPLRENVRSGNASNERIYGGDANMPSKDQNTGSLSPTFSGLATSPLPCGLPPTSRLAASPPPHSSAAQRSPRDRPFSVDDEIITRRKSTFINGDSHGKGRLARDSPPPPHRLLATSLLPHRQPARQSLIFATSHSDVRMTTSSAAAGEKGLFIPSGPVFKLDLVFPAADILRGVFEGDQRGVLDLLNQLKTKSTSLCRIAEGVSHVQTLKSLNPTLALALRKSADTMYSNALSALSGDDTCQAECLLAADEWSSAHLALEEGIASSLQPWEGLFGVTGSLIAVQTSVVEDVKESVSRMITTLLDTMKADKYCTATPDVTHQATEWNNLCADLLKESELFRANSEDQHLKDQLSHKRMLCIIKLSRLLEVGVGYLRRRQERWVEVISGDGWMTETRDRMSTMRRETDVYVGLCNLVSSWNTPATEDVDTLTRVKEDIEDVCMIITDPKRYGKEGALTVFYLLEWCSLMHQLSDWLDRLSAHGALRVDRLLSSAHAAHTSSGPSKQHFLVEFQGQSEALSSAVTQVRQVSVAALMAVSSHPHKTMVLTSLEELCRVTPKLISLCRDLADDVLPSLSELSHVKRLWVCHATSIIRGLQGLPNVDEKKLTDIERNLRGASAYGSTLQGPVLLQSMSTISSSQSQNQYLGYSHMGPGLGDVTGSHVTDSRRFKGGTGTTGLASSLYTDTSHTWQGTDPRLVTASKTDTKPRPDSSYRSQPLGLNEAPDNTAHTSSLPAAPCKPPLHRTDSANFYGSIEATALMLQQEADKWETSDNAYIQTIKRLSKNMNTLTSYAKKPGNTIPKAELIQAARLIATEAGNIHRFAEIFARYATDVQFAGELESQSKQIPALAKQLNIIATVKSATPADYNSDVAIVTNAKRVMEAVVQTITAAETLCVKGLRVIEGASPEEVAAASLAAQLKRKLQRHRRIEASSPEVDALGLRRISKNASVPSLTEIFHKTL